MSITPNSGFVHAAVETLRAAGRPLNTRKILMGAVSAGWAAPEAVDLDSLKAQLRAATAGRLIDEVRPGVFALTAGGPLTIDAPPIELEALESVDEDEMSIDELSEPTPTADLESVDMERERKSRRRRDRDDDRRKRKRRGARDLAGDTPLAPMSVEEIATRAARGEDLGAAAWRRMTAKAAALLGVPPEEIAAGAPILESAPEPPKRKRSKRPKKAEPAAEVLVVEQAAEIPAAGTAETIPAVSEPVEAPTQTGEAPADPKARIRARLRGRGASEAPAPATASGAEPGAEIGAEPGVTREERQAMTAAVKARLRERVATPEMTPPPSEEVMIISVISVLREAGGPITAEEIIDDLGFDGPQDEDSLVGLIKSENARRLAEGQRPPLTRLSDGRLALTDWYVSERYRALEREIQVAITEQRELVRKDLLNRIAQLDADGFTAVLTDLLEAKGFGKITVVHQNQANILLRAGEGQGAVAIMGCSAVAPIKKKTVAAFASHLDRLGAAKGLILTLGAFEEGCAEVEGDITLLDRDDFARTLQAHQIGLATYRPEIGFTDGAYFSALS